MTVVADRVSGAEFAGTPARNQANAGPALFIHESCLITSSTRIARAAFHPTNNCTSIRGPDRHRYRLSRGPAHLLVSFINGNRLLPDETLLLHLLRDRRRMLKHVARHGVHASEEKLLAVHSNGTVIVDDVPFQGG